MQLNLLSKVGFIILSSLFLLGCDNTNRTSVDTGYIEANYLYINAPSSGWITQQSVKEGTQISIGQPLFALDNRQQKIHLTELEQQLAQQQALLVNTQQGARSEELQLLAEQKKSAEIALQLNQLSLTRAQQTAKQKLSSQADLDKATADYQLAQQRVVELNQQIAVAKLAARAPLISAQQANVQAMQQQLANAQWLLAQRNINALRAGVVDQLFYRQGEYVNQGQPVLSILLLNSKKVRFFVSQQQLSTLKLNQHIQVRCDCLSQPVSATINHIAKDAEFTPPVLYSQGSRNKLVFLVEAKLTNPAILRAGQPVDVIL